MVRDDLHITVPSYFRCPISLDVMKSPVSLCTGVTYDRTSIQRWLDAGHNTCPATMQLLHTTQLTPNHTLHRLINLWSHSLPPTSPPPELTPDQATTLLQSLLTHPPFPSPSTAHTLSALTSFAAESDENPPLLAAAAAPLLPQLVSLIGRAEDLSFLEKIISFCNVLLKNPTSEMNSKALPSRINIENSGFKSAILMGLKEGRLELRIAVAKFLESLARNTCVEISTCSISEDDCFHPALLRLVAAADPEAALSLLARSARSKRNRARIVRAGGVAALTAVLAGGEGTGATATERALEVLEMVAGSKEGRSEICGGADGGGCVRAVVRKVLKVSGAATERAVAVLWSLCCLYGEKRAAAAVVESNGMAKILVVMQSGCSPAVRRMCGDLLRVFRCSSKSSCVSWYDTKTTHIMPF